MRIKVKMPKLGLTMTGAKVLEWCKSVNHEVNAGEVLFVVETEKANIEVEAPATGTLVEIVGEVGQVYPVGEILAVIQTVGP